MVEAYNSVDSLLAEVKALRAENSRLLRHGAVLVSALLTVGVTIPKCPQVGAGQAEAGRDAPPVEVEQLRTGLPGGEWRRFVHHECPQPRPRREGVTVQTCVDAGCDVRDVWYSGWRKAEPGVSK